MKKRFFDFFISSILLFLLIFPIFLICIILRSISEDNIFYWSRRVGLHNSFFLMPKFRTMHMKTPEIASNLLKDPSNYLTPFGSFLRKSSLDELPQLWSVLKGDMSLVGPRPALFNQYDLIKLRTSKGIHHLRPGLTGWAQVNGRDDLSIKKKVNFDEEYLKKRSFIFDLKILYLTFIKIIRREGIRH